MSNLMVRLATGILTLCALIVGMSSTAMAQEDEQRVMILRFDTFDVETEVMDTFYRSLNDHINAHDGKTVVPGGEVSINEMIVTVGCEGPTPECLSQLQDFVEADQLLFGSVQRSEDIYLFTIKLFDFDSQSFESVIEDQTVQGDRDRVIEVIPTVIDGLLYGDVGRLQVEVQGADAPDVFLDGEKVGKAPTQLEDLPLGEHVLMLRTSDGEEQTQRVLITREEQAQVRFNFGSGPEGISKPSKNKLAIPGGILIAAGVVGLGYGTYQYLGYYNDSQWLLDNTVCTGGGVNGDGTCEEPALKADSDRNDMPQDDYASQRTRALIGWSAGGALTVIGTALIIVGKNKKEANSATLESPSLKDRIQVDVVTQRGYQGLQLRGSF